MNNRGRPPSEHWTTVASRARSAPYTWVECGRWPLNYVARIKQGKLAAFRDGDFLVRTSDGSRLGGPVTTAEIRILYVPRSE